ncbi:hypothetical protein LINPERPRIM_LOCUS33504 [Linum perenne]
MPWSPTHCNAADPTRFSPARCQRRSDRLRSVTMFGRCDSADGRFDELLPS